MVAKTFAGLEGVLAEELKGIGAEDVKILRRAVGFTGDDEILYKANYLCRTALRVLVLIDTFGVKNEEDLYNRIAKTNWSKYMDHDSTFAIDAVVFNSCITHTKYAALKMKDAIVDQFRRKFNTRPDVDTKRPDFRLSIHIENDNCLLYIDSSGSSLNKRGYRVASNEAPMNEVLAAGLIKLSGWDGKSNFVDPMCGSGTILIEAAMLASNIPAGYYRKYFSFISWKSFNADLWKKIVDECDAEVVEAEGEIVGSDISAESIEICKQNIEKAKLHHDITLKQVSIQESVAPEGGGILITNPPYDERLEIEDATLLYQEIGDALKTAYKGYSTWLITSNTEALKFVGLATDKRIPLFNGALECTFAKYEIYEGSKRTPRRDADFKPREAREYKPRRNEEYLADRRSDYSRNRGERNSDRDNKREDRGERGFRRDENRGERRFDGNRGERKFDRGGSRPERGERKFDRDNNRGERKFDRSGDRSERGFKRDDSRGDKPFRRDENRGERGERRFDGNRGERKFDRGGSRPERGERKFDRDNNRGERKFDRSGGRSDRGFRRDENRGERGERRFDGNRGERKFDRSGSRPERGERKFDRDNNRGERKFDRSGGRSDRGFKRDDNRSGGRADRDNNRGERRFDRNRGTKDSSSREGRESRGPRNNDGFKPRGRR